MGDKPEFKQESISLTRHLLILRAVEEMGRFYVEDNKAKFFRSVVRALNLTERELESTTMQRIEHDRETLELELKKIKEKDGMNETTKEQEILKLQYDFALKHQFFAYLGLEENDIYKKSKEGELDFDKINYETIKHIVRAGGGLQNSIDRVTEREGNGTPTN